MSLEKRARDYSAAAAAPAPDGKSLHARVPDAFAGLRLDQALARLFPAYSRSRLQNWVKSAAFTRGHVQARADSQGTVAHGSALMEFEVVDLQA